ncbi:MAG: AI-2E family transporter [Planctomycetota bacterium]
MKESQQDGAFRPPGFVLLLVALSTTLLTLIVAPFAASFFAAAVLAGVMHPLQLGLEKRLGGRAGLAALLLTVGLTVLAVGPLAGLCIFVAQQGTAIYQSCAAVYRSEGIQGLVDQLPEALQQPANWIRDHWPGSAEAAGGASGIVSGAAADPAAADAAAGTAAAGASAAGGLLSGTNVATATDVVTAVVHGLGSVLLDLAILVVTLFFLLQQGRHLVDWCVRVLPLSDGEARRLVGEFRDVTRAVFVATIATAFLQTLIALIGYLIAGISYLPIVLLLTFVCAVIPVVGAAMVVLAAGAVLWLDGSAGYGIFLIIWGLLPVGLSDNIAKPWLAQGKLRLPGPVVLFAMLGGVVVFGAFGIVAGPLIIAFFLASLRLLQKEGVVPSAATE